MARIVFPVVLAVLALGTGRARAQGAWTPEKNTLSLGASYQLGYGTRSENLTATVIHNYLIPEVEYGITDSLAVSAQLPILAVKASDAGMFAHGSWDDGAYHSTPTDLRINARYMFPLGIVALTPEIGASTPVREYEVKGFAAAGRGLKAAYVGLNIGVDLNDYIPRSTVNVAYELAIVEKFSKAGPDGEGIDQNYSTFTAQISHTIGHLQLHAGVDYHYNHGGITFANFNTITMNQKTYHDGLLAERILLVGGGLSYAVSDHVDVYAIARIFTAGENTHNSSVFAVGASWDIGL